MWTRLFDCLVFFEIPFPTERHNLQKTNINPVSFDIHTTFHGDELDATLSNKDSIFRYSFKQIKFNL